MIDADGGPRTARTRQRPAPGNAAVLLPQSLATLIGRYHARAIALPAYGARIRLVVTGDGQWDVQLHGDEAIASNADLSAAPDATLTTDAATWDGIARDLRSGMDAFRSGRLVIRHNLH